MNHTASRNWGNVRKNPEAGIQTAPPVANRTLVKILLSGNEDESIRAVRHHRGNESWLRLALEIESGRHFSPPRPAVVKLIGRLLNDPSQPSKPYEVGRCIGGTWGFRTPVGKVDGFSSREDAERAAISNERDDRAEAESGTGIIATALRKYFSSEKTSPATGMTGDAMNTPA